MANWGEPQFTDTVESRQVAQTLRSQLAAQGRVVQFAHNGMVERGYSPDLVQHHCVRDSDWQAIRLSMKGINTVDKLEVLHAYWDRHHDTAVVGGGYNVVEIQVGNYLGALRRGGQLDDLNRIRKAR